MRTTIPAASSEPLAGSPEAEKPKTPRATRVARTATEQPAPAVAVQRAEGGQWNIEGRARGIRLDTGLHALIVGKSTTRPEAVGGVTLPVTQVAPWGVDRVSATIVSTSGGDNGWLGAAGGTVIIKAAGPDVSVFVTTFGITDEAALPVLKMVNLDRLADAESPATPAAAPQGRELAGELVLHIERQGDRRFSAAGWAGNPGERLRIEGFAIRPLEAIAPGQIEYMAFGPSGRQTPWVTDARMCGTRGRGLPLTGFAIRLAPALRERFDVVYEGYFFDSGVRGPLRNGEPCLPSIADDPLSAIRFRVVERPGG